MIPASVPAIINTPWRIGLAVALVVVVVLLAAGWYLLGQFVLGYAQMEAEERLEELAPPRERAAASDSRRPARTRTTMGTP